MTTVSTRQAALIATTDKISREHPMLSPPVPSLAHTRARGNTEFHNQFPRRRYQSIPPRRLTMRLDVMRHCRVAAYLMATTDGKKRHWRSLIGIRTSHLTRCRANDKVWIRLPGICLSSDATQYRRVGLLTTAQYE